MKGGSKLRGTPLDKDCKTAHTTTHKYGKDDNRIFCYGIVDLTNDELLEKCKVCNAHIDNSTPI